MKALIQAAINDGCVRWPKKEKKSRKATDEADSQKTQGRGKKNLILRRKGVSGDGNLLLVGTSRGPGVRRGLGRKGLREIEHQRGRDPIGKGGKGWSGPLIAESSTIEHKGAQTSLSKTSAEVNVQEKLGKVLIFFTEKDRKGLFVAEAR